MKALLLIMLGGVLVNNYALEKFLGVGPVLGGRKYGSAAMGFSVAAVMLLAAAVTWPLYRLLVLLGAEYLETLIFVLVVLLVVYDISYPEALNRIASARTSRSSRSTARCSGSR